MGMTCYYIFMYATIVGDHVIWPSISWSVRRGQFNPKRITNFALQFLAISSLFILLLLLPHHTPISN